MKKLILCCVLSLSLTQNLYANPAESIGQGIKALVVIAAVSTVGMIGFGVSWSVEKFGDDDEKTTATLSISPEVNEKLVFELAERGQGVDDLLITLEQGGDLDQMKEDLGNGPVVNTIFDKLEEAI